MMRTCFASVDMMHLHQAKSGYLALQKFAANMEHWQKRRRIFKSLWWVPLSLTVVSGPGGGQVMDCVDGIPPDAGVRSARTSTGRRPMFLRRLVLRPRMTKIGGSCRNSCPTSGGAHDGAAPTPQCQHASDGLLAALLVANVRFATCNVTWTPGVATQHFMQGPIEVPFSLPEPLLDGR